MDITLTTPALLFPTVSLLMVAYTNRFLALSRRIRNLNTLYRSNNNIDIINQIDSLRKRVILIKNMQALAIVSLMLCVLCMLSLFIGNLFTGKVFFGLALSTLMISLILSLNEILLSTHALNIELGNLKKESENA